MADKKKVELRRLGVQRRAPGAEKPKTRSTSKKKEERELLKKLLDHRHLSVPDMLKLPEWRKANGLILRDIIVEELREHECYPPGLKGDGDLIHGIIQKGPRAFHVYLTGEETACSDAESAAVLYLEQNHESFDGLTIDWSPLKPD